MNSFARAVIDSLIDEIEGDVADIPGDSGGVTVFGLSSKYYPGYVRRALTLIANGQRAVAREEAAQIYFQDYYTRIYGWRELEAQYPWLLSMLFNGRVHGTGQRDYVREVQTFLNKGRQTPLVADGQLGARTLSALLSLPAESKDALFDYLTSEQVVNRLVQRRQEAVQNGGARNVERGIRNRLVKERSLASATFERSEGNMDVAVTSSSEEAMTPWRGSTAVEGLEVRSLEPQEGAYSTKLVSV